MAAAGINGITQLTGNVVSSLINLAQPSLQEQAFEKRTNFISKKMTDAGINPAYQFAPQAGTFSNRTNRLATTNQMLPQSLGGPPIK